MSVTLIVEDGSIVTNANTYASVAVVKTYAAQRGVTLNSSSTVIGTQLIKAMDYFMSFRDQWKGWKVETDQPQQWPRDGVQIDGNDWPLDTIPQELIDAQCALVVAQTNGVDIMADAASGVLPVIKDKVGPLETTYASPNTLAGFDWASISLPTVDALLAPLLESAGLRLHTVRI